MFDPLRILRWLGKICVVFAPIIIILERGATWCLNAAFKFRGLAVPSNTQEWIFVVHDAFQSFWGRTEQEPKEWLLRLSQKLPDWLGPATSKFLLVLPNLLALILSVILLGWFIKSLYDLPSTNQGTNFALRSAFGKRGFSPFLIYRQGGEEIDEVDGETLRNIGGPGSILLERDTAVVLEKAGVFTRVELPPGVVKLERFERVYAKVDLRPRVWPFTVSAMSKEGIPVNCKVNVHFQVDPEGGEEAVFKAATCTWVRGKHWLEDKLDWAGRVIISNTEGTLRSILARLPLDQLVPAQITHPTAGTRGASPKRVIRERIEADLRNSLERNAPDLGVIILEVHLGDIEVSEVIREQWADIWRTGWRSWATETVNEGKLSYREIIENAKIAGQVEILGSLGAVLRELREQEVPITNELLALHFLDVIENTQGLPEGWMQSYLPPALMHSLERIKHL